MPASQDLGSATAKSKTRKRRVHSIRNELVRKAREAALTSVQIFNNPLIKFKSESFIILMIIAWTYLLHAYYRSTGVDYRYRQKGSMRFARTKHGAIRHWELEECLRHPSCPIDAATKENLILLIGLRHEIEHQMSMSLDAFLSPRFQACALNFSHYAKVLFGDDKSIDEYLSFAIQLRHLSREQVEGIEIEPTIDPELRTFIAKFDESLAEETRNSERYSVNIHFERRVKGKSQQSDSKIEFVAPSDSNSSSDKWTIQEREKQKFGAKTVVHLVRAEGFSRFSMHHHTQLWKSLDARSTDSGYGCYVEKQWFWYEKWIECVRAYCSANRGRFE